MTKSKYSEVEMIGALKPLEAGGTAAHVGRQLGVSKHTVYAWKAKYGGMTVHDGTGGPVPMAAHGISERVFCGEHAGRVLP